MYPLTIGLAIENRELWEQAQATLARSAVPGHRRTSGPGRVSNFMDRLERMRPDVVLIDISNWKEPLEGLVSSIRNAAGDPMIIALNTNADADSILSSMRAGVNEYLFPPLQETLRQALEKRSTERSRRNSDGAKGGGKAVGLPLRQGRLRRHHARLPCGRGTGPAEPEGAAGRSRPGCRHGRLHHQDQVDVLDSGRGQQPPPSGHQLSGKRWSRTAFPASRSSPRRSRWPPRRRRGKTRCGTCSPSPVRITTGPWSISAAA